MVHHGARWSRWPMGIQSWFHAICTVIPADEAECPSPSGQASAGGGGAAGWQGGGLPGIDGSNVGYGGMATNGGQANNGYGAGGGAGVYPITGNNGWACDLSTMVARGIPAVEEAQEPKLGGRSIREGEEVGMEVAAEPVPRPAAYYTVCTNPGAGGNLVFIHPHQR